MAQFFVLLHTVFKKLPKVNNLSLGEKSPNSVTLMWTYIVSQISRFSRPSLLTGWTLQRRMCLENKVVYAEPERTTETPEEI
jgi:hypothetical protein